MAQSYHRFEDAGVALAMVSVDSPRRTRQFVAGAVSRPPFPVLSDVDVDATVAYDVFADGIAIASTFLIDAGGVVRWAYVGDRPSDRPAVDQLLAQVAALHGADPA